MATTEIPWQQLLIAGEWTNARSGHTYGSSATESNVGHRV
jgi:hypothetical protein